MSLVNKKWALEKKDDDEYMPKVDYKIRKQDDNLSKQHLKVWETRRKNNNYNQSAERNRRSFEMQIYHHKGQRL